MFLRKLFTCLMLLLIINPLVSQERFIARIDYQNSKTLSILQKHDFNIVNIEPQTHIDLLLNQTQLQILKSMGFQPTIRTTEQELMQNLQNGLMLEGYHSYDEILSLMQDYADNYSDICSLHNLGSSRGKQYFEAGYGDYEAFQHDIWVLKISDNPNEEEDEPSLLFDAAHHARETISVEVVLHFMKHLLENYNQDPVITDAVNNNQIWLLPLVNPDGHKLVTDSTEVWWRKTIRDNNLNGTIDPFMPDWIEPDGVDPNRNYGGYWGGDWNSSPSFRETYAGPHAFSEPCTQAMRDLIESHQFVTELSYHSYGEKFFYPWGHNTQNHYTPDHLLYSTLGNELAGMTPRLTNGNYTAVSSGYYNLFTGGTTDYAYGQFGTIAYVVELAQDFIPAADDIEAVCIANLNAQRYILERVHKSILTGHVYDANTNEPLLAKIYIDGIDSLPNGRKDYHSNIQFGRFYRLLNPGEYGLSISAFGYTTQHFPSIVIQDDGPTNLEVYLPVADAFELTGYVKNRDGYPIPDAQIVVLNQDIDTIWSGSDGYFQFDSFYEGTYEIEVAADGFFSSTASYSINDQQNILFIELGSYQVIDFETEEITEYFSMFGHQDWSRTDMEAYEGEYSFAAPILNIKQFATTSTKLYFDTDVLLSLSVKVSLDSITQGMVFIMDETMLNRYWGDQEWVRDTFFIPMGSHKFRWSVSRDFRTPGSQYENQCWIDEIAIEKLSTQINTEITSESALFNIFPNPSSGSISIEADAKVNAIYQARVYDVKGETIAILNPTSFSNQVLSWNGFNSASLPVPNGIYFIKLHTDSGSSVEKLVIHR